MSNPLFDSLSGNFDARAGLFDNPVINTAFTADAITGSSPDVGNPSFDLEIGFSGSAILTGNADVNEPSFDQVNSVSADDI